MEALTLDILTQRLDRLERENRWWKLGGTFAVAALTVILFMGVTGTKVADEIRARRFVAVDQDGTPRAALSGEPSLYFFTKSGRDLVRLVVQGGLGPNLWMMSETENHSRIRLAAQNDGAFLNMTFPFRPGETRSGTAFFGALENGAGLRFNTDGLRSWAAELLLDEKRKGEPALRLYNNNGKVIWKAP